MVLTPARIWPAELGVEHALAPAPDNVPGVYVGCHSDGTIARVTVQWPSDTPYTVFSSSLEIGAGGGGVLARTTDTIVHETGIEHLNMWDDNSAPRPFPAGFSVEQWVRVELASLLGHAAHANASRADWWYRERRGEFELRYPPTTLPLLAASGFPLSFLQLTPVPPHLVVAEAVALDRGSLDRRVTVGTAQEILVLFDEGVGENVSYVADLRAARAAAGLPPAIVRVTGGARGWLLGTGRGAAFVPPPPPPPPSWR